MNRQVKNGGASKPPVRTVTAEPAVPARPMGSFLQTVRVIDGGMVLGTARWHTLGLEDGVAQVLDIEVHPDHRRKRIGRELMLELERQAIAYFKAKQVRPRRLWLGVAQETHVIARAYLTGHGFHHVSTVSNLHKGQDLLIYTKSLD